MAIGEQFLKLLEQFGFNTTKLRWRMYKAEQRLDRLKQSKGTPSSLRWMGYQHKFCPKCGALADRESKRCPKCDARLPSVLGYKAFRLLGLVTPQGSTPVTYVFLTAMVFFFLVSMAMQGASAFLGPTRLTMFVFGAFPPAIIDEGVQLWRIFGFALVHAGIMHIGFNSIALFQVGPVLEREVGSARLLTVITVTQFAAAVATYLWYYRVRGAGPGYLTVGASGFLFGLIGYGITYCHRQGPAGKMYRDFFFHWLVYGVVFGLLLGANNAAHIGGAIGGALLGLLPEPHPRRSPLWRHLWNTGGAVSAVIWTATVCFLVYSIWTNWTPGGTLE